MAASGSMFISACALFALVACAFAQGGNFAEPTSQQLPDPSAFLQPPVAGQPLTYVQQGMTDFSIRPRNKVALVQDSMAFQNFQQTPQDFQQTQNFQQMPQSSQTLQTFQQTAQDVQQTSQNFQQMPQNFQPASQNFEQEAATIEELHVALQPPSP